MDKKVIVAFLIGVVVCLCVTTLFNSTPLPQVNAGGGSKGGAVDNGDVNGDGNINLADAIYLLTYLFSDGPAPEVIEALPATGQTKCYDTNGNVIDCGSADWPGQDGFYQEGYPMADRYTDNGDGTVSDNCTGLMWQQDTASIGESTWQDALKYCEDLELAGHDDWRLPNRRELQSLVDLSRYDPAIDPVFSAESSYYWSSSTYESYTDIAWYVLFSHGYVSHSFKTNHVYVRAVRGRP